MPEKLWLKVCDIVQETVIKMIKMIQEKEMQKSKMAVQEGLTNISEKKRIKKQRRKGKIYPSECRARRIRIARRDKKAFSVINAKI